jgi:predicted RNA-binding protein
MDRWVKIARFEHPAAMQAIIDVMLAVSRPEMIASGRFLRRYLNNFRTANVVLLPCKSTTRTSGRTSLR